MTKYTPKFAVSEKSFTLLSFRSTVRPDGPAQSAFQYSPGGIKNSINPGKYSISRHKGKGTRREGKLPANDSQLPARAPLRSVCLHAMISPPADLEPGNRVNPVPFPSHIRGSWGVGLNGAPSLVKSSYYEASKLTAVDSRIAALSAAHFL